MRQVAFPLTLKKGEVLDGRLPAPSNLALRVTALEDVTFADEEEMEACCLSDDPSQQIKFEVMMKPN